MPRSIEEIEKELNEMQKKIDALKNELKGVENENVKIYESKQDELEKNNIKNEKKSTLKRFDDDELTVSKIYDINPKICNQCGSKLILQGNSTRDELEINIRLEKIRYEFMKYLCPQCQKIIEVKVPEKLQFENQYGSNLKALVIALLNEGVASFKKTRELMDIFTKEEAKLNEKYIMNLQKSCFEKLEEFEKDLKNKILSQKEIEEDMLEIIINQKQANLKLYSTKKLAYYTTCEREINENYPIKKVHKEENFVIDMKYRSANSVVDILTRLIDLKDNLNHSWFEELCNLLFYANCKIDEFNDQSVMYFDQEVSDEVIKKFDKIMKKAKKENKEDYDDVYGEKEKLLIKDFIDNKEIYLLWVLRHKLPIGKEDDKSLKTKSTWQFASIQNAMYFARIKSYIETTKKNGISIKKSLVRLIIDNPYSIDELKIK